VSQLPELKEADAPIVRDNPLEFAGDAPRFPWYGIRTRANQERNVAASFAGKGYECFLPMYRCRKRRSDRVVVVEAPLFPGYTFCRFDYRQRLPIMTTLGVVSIIGFGCEPAPVADHEIEAIEKVLKSGFAAEPHPFLHIGQRIRINHGALKGVEGILLQKKSEWRLVVSVNMLQRSVSVEIDPSCISTN
jgi:transcription elongation factor/antiterminator RfaH